jgi:hypothetical protein
MSRISFSFLYYSQEIVAHRHLEQEERWRSGFLGDASPVWVASSDEVSFLLLSGILGQSFYCRVILKILVGFLE